VLEPGADTVTIALLPNPLDMANRTVWAARPGAPFIDWLQCHYPDGFGAGITLARNGHVVPIADADFITAPGDVVTIIVHPGHPGLGALILKAVITAAISAAASLVFNLIFSKPRAPSSQQLPQPDPIYSITGAQNAARVGDPVPALYGHMLTTPDFAAQPYTYFDANNQYIAQILVIGWGEYDLNDVRVGDTPVSALQSDALTYWHMGPGDHAQTMGRIEAATGVMENVVTSPEVSSQEFSQAPPVSGNVFEASQLVATFVAPNRIDNVVIGPLNNVTGYDWLQVSGTDLNDRTYSVAGYSPGQDGNTWTVIVNENTIVAENFEGGTRTFIMRWFNSTDTANLAGPFITAKPGAVGDRIMCDFVFPQGLYDVNQSTGAMTYMSATFEIQYQPVDDAGNPLAGWTAYPVSLSRATTTPVRVTYTINVPAARYRVQVLQTSPPPPSGGAQANFNWTALKMRLQNVPGPVYGQTTLLVVRVRATNGISAQASSRITADVTRRLPALGVGALRATRDPADAFVDIYTNPLYGAQRPLSEVDTAELARLQAHWAGRAFFDGGFAQKSTIWEALGIVMQTAGAAPLPLGQLMSAAQDGVKALRTQLYSDANMDKGTLTIGYSFDKPGDYDGVRVEYRDPATWNPLYVQWPDAAVDPDAVQLFGCADAGQALGFARLLWQKRQGQRKSATFDTDLEGLLPRLGDRVAIAVQLPRWGVAGVVSSVDGLTLRLDAPVDWTAPEGGYFAVLRNEWGAPSQPIAISPSGRTPFEIVLAAAPPFALYGTGGQEPTHYAVGTAIQQVADFTVANIAHKGGAAVTIEALSYDPNTYAGTLPWLVEPI
jgi:hypothetical protein